MDFIIRPATLNDAMDCADIHAASWRFAYRGIVPKEIVDAYSVRWPITEKQNQAVFHLLESCGMYIGSMSRMKAGRGNLYGTKRLYSCKN